MNSKTIFSLLLIVLVQLSIQANVTVINGLTHIYSTDLGKTINGDIVLKNTSLEKEERITVYLKDFHQLCDRKTKYFDVGTSEYSLAKWVTFNINEKVLAPGEKFIVNYQLVIPDTEEELGKDQGSFWSMIMIEVAEPINEQEERGVQINSQIRYGIQLIANIGQKINPEIEFNDVELSKTEEGIYEVKVKLENKGIFVVKPSLMLELIDENGESIMKTEAQFKKVYPKNCKDFVIEIASIPVGMYEGVLIADYGGDIYGINLTVEITDN